MVMYNTMEPFFPVSQTQESIAVQLAMQHLQ